ncbi:MAG: hypothetical protein ACLRVQ_02185 [Lachnospiraceae bacterium]
MSKTGYSHIKKYTEIYNKCISDEKRIRGINRRNINKNEVISIMGDMRGTLESIIGYMIKETGLTDGQILRIMEDRNIKSEGKKPSLYGRIVALEYIGALSSGMAHIVHGRIRKPGNNAVHYYEKNPENNLVTAGPGETLRYAEKMYQSIQQLTHYFAEDFMVRVRKYEKIGKRKVWLRIFLGAAVIAVLAAIWILTVK